MLSTSLLRTPSCSITTPTNSSGTSTVSFSTGSISLPSTRLVTISGFPTMSSKPSRRIISIRIESCSSPRPITMNESVVAVSSTRKETLVSNSFCKRSRRFREVTYVPSRPANGEVFTVNSMAIVGSSIVMCGSGAGFSASVMVSPIVMPSTPATAIISPRVVSVMSVRFKPENENSLVIFVLCSDPSSLAMATSSPVRMVPLNTRAMAKRPR